LLDALDALAAIFRRDTQVARNAESTKFASILAVHCAAPTTVMGICLSATGDNLGEIG